ncbi:unnamed protein product [Choristocarpus tenellus]
MFTMCIFLRLEDDGGLGVRESKSPLLPMLMGSELCVIFIAVQMKHPPMPHVLCHCLSCPYSSFYTTLESFAAHNPLTNLTTRLDTCTHTRARARARARPVPQSQWALIARSVPGRSVNSTKNHWFTMTRGSGSMCNSGGREETRCGVSYNGDNSTSTKIGTANTHGTHLGTGMGIWGGDTGGTLETRFGIRTRGGSGTAAESEGGLMAQVEGVGVTTGAGAGAVTRVGSRAGEGMERLGAQTRGSFKRQLHSDGGSERPSGGAATSGVMEVASPPHRLYPVVQPAQRWLPHQSEMLKFLVEQNGAKNWTSIAKRIPPKTDLQCMLHWNHVMNPDLTKGKGSWKPEEDARIIEMVEQFGHKWSIIASKLKSEDGKQTRVGKQIRERYLNHLDPDLKKGPWTEEEERILVQQHAIHDNKWVLIGKALQGRCDNDIKNHWYAHQRRNKERALMHRVEQPEATVNSSAAAVATATTSASASVPTVSTSVPAEHDSLEEGRGALLETIPPSKRVRPTGMESNV